MTELKKTNYLLEVERGNLPGETWVHKFGGNPAASTNLEPLTVGAVYATPTTAQTLELLSDDTGDTSAGLGARKVVVEGLDSSFNIQSETVTMNGTTAVILSAIVY